MNRRLLHGRDECYGTTEVNGRRFMIRISTKLANNTDDFADTLLHELLHLFFFVLSGLLKLKISNKVEHQIIERTTKFVMRQVKYELKKKVKR